MKNDEENVTSYGDQSCETPGSPPEGVIGKLHGYIGLITAFVLLLGSFWPFENRPVTGGAGFFDKTIVSAFLWNTDRGRMIDATRWGCKPDDFLDANGNVFYQSPAKPNCYVLDLVAWSNASVARRISNDSSYERYMMELWSMRVRLPPNPVSPATSEELTRANQLAGILLEQVAYDLNRSRDWLKSAQIFIHIVLMIVVGLILLNRRDVGKIILSPLVSVVSVVKNIHERV